MPPDPVPLAGGLYVHVPFCLRKCRYCDFYSTTDLSLTDAWLKGVQKEIGLRAPGAPSFDTLYFGGGTPSLLHPQQLETLLKAIRTAFRLAGDAEITLEVNPGTIGPEPLDAYRSLGVNRLSIGVQSFQDPGLRFLGRIHTAEGAREAIRLARQAGFDNLGLDLIYGLPRQGPAAWMRDLAEAVSFGPEHLSCYLLTVEPGTPLARDCREGRFIPPGDDRLARLFQETSRFLEGRGYEHYEISNFARRGDGARPSFRSRHNRKYWTYAPYLGLGPGAHSFLPPVRSWNHRRLTAYLDALQRGNRLPVQGEETPAGEAALLERIYLGLRQRDGICFDAFRLATGIDLATRARPQLERLREEGMMVLDERGCRLTIRGMTVLDGIAGMLV